MWQWLLYKENEPLIFSTAVFWIFFGVVLIGYLFIYQHNRARTFYLTAVSLYFYYLSGGYFFVLLIISTLVDYHIGKKIYQSDNPVVRKWLVATSVAINLAILGYFKYTYFLTDVINQLAGTQLQAIDWLALIANTIMGTSFDINNIILPVGISFYTFQTISYSVDIYRRKLKPVNDIWDFAFFVSFFPQLVAGPIVRAAEFIPQIYQSYQLSAEEFGRAIFLILNGLVKKIFISDYISVNFVDRVFESPLSYSGFENLMAVYGYSIQIYCDFSGYSDIAIGLALLLGFRLPINFNSPYKAHNITDFWRRWHISLSSWLRDYLYISLGGNRKGKLRTYMNLLLTMLLGGLWHGAHVRFIIWGALHGVALAVHKIWMEIFGKKDTPSTFWASFWSGLLTFHFVAFCWIFFRAENMQLVSDMLSQITHHFQAEMMGQVLVAYHKIFLVMVIGFTAHWLPTWFKNAIANQFTALPDFAKAIVIAFVALLLFQVKTADIQPFIYFQF
ncbi:MAG: MBOAT family O-acyltransferase [Cytophagales bacterium]|nr:MBOAT family protein [Bernardetiaceae bacterium]MDW8211302.1 MBOAT family O-acyltransferase [Cytophagales bacterium]